MGNETVTTPDSSTVGGVGALSGNDYNSANAAPTATTPAPAPGTSPLQPNPPAGPAPEIGLPAPGSFGDKLGQELGIIGRHPNAPAVMAKPGGWAKAMLGGVMSALSKGANRVAEHGGIGSYFPGSEESQGPLGSLVGALRQQSNAAQAARDKATKEQQEQESHDMEMKVKRQQYAADNARQIAQERLAHQLGEAEVEKNIDEGKSTLAFLATQEHKPDILEEGVRAKDIPEKIIQHLFKPSEDTAYPSGKVDTGDKDAQGRPIEETTYTLVHLGPVTLDEAEAGKLNKALGRTDISAGQVIPGETYNSLKQDARNRATQATALAQAADKNKVDAAKLAEEVAKVDLGPAFTKAVSDAKYKGAAPRDAVMGAIKTLENQAKQDPAFAAKYSNIRATVRGIVGEKEFDDMENKYQDHLYKMAEERAKQITDNINNMGSNANSAPMTPELEAKIASLDPAKQAILKKYDTNTQASLMSVAYGNGEQDFKTIFPTRLTKGAPGLNAQQALGAISMLTDNKWSEQGYAVKHAAYVRATSSQTADKVESLNNFIGHAGLARQINNELWNLRDKAPRIFDTPINKLSTAGYGTQYTRLADALEVVNSEFETMIHSGHVATEQQSDAMRVINNPNSTVGQVNAALDVMGHVAQTRANSINNIYKTGTGDYFPNLIFEENQEAAKSIGMDTSKYYVGGRIGGGTINPSQLQNTQTGQQAGAQTAPNPHAGEMHGGVMRTPQAQPTGHAVNDIIVQNGRQMKVTSVDQTGRVTGAVAF